MLDQLTQPATVSSLRLSCRRSPAHGGVADGQAKAIRLAGDELMILEVGLSSPAGQAATVKREDVFLRTPDGKRLSVPSQKEFAEAWGGLRPVISKANIDRDPLDYFPPSRIECAIQFFVEPGMGVSFDEVTLNHQRGCFGRFFFKVPGGIQQGRWLLGIDQPESEIRIPFDLGE